MKQTLLYIGMALSVALLFGGCTKERDLYGVSHPLLYIEGDWQPSLGKTNMSQDATAMLYRSGDGLYDKEYFYNPDNVTARVTSGAYDILLFNGLMYAENDTHLDGILFRNTDKIGTFEAYAKEGTANRRLQARADDYITTNDMELLTSLWTSQTVEGNNEYYIKYRDGKNGYPVVPDYVESEIYMVPRPISYHCNVMVTLVNPRSAAVANGALRGFVGSVFMQSRMPSHIDVTHQFRLNNLTPISPDPATGDPSGTIESPEFVTFGPPLDLPDRIYEFEISILLQDETSVNRTFDVTEQVELVIDQITAQLNPAVPVSVITIPIVIDEPIVLPKMPDAGVGVGDWSDDELITVPIHRP